MVGGQFFDLAFEVGVNVADCEGDLGFNLEDYANYANNILHKMLSLSKPHARHDIFFTCHTLFDGGSDVQDYC